MKYIAIHWNQTIIWNGFLLFSGSWGLVIGSKQQSSVASKLFVSLSGQLFQPQIKLGRQSSSESQSPLKTKCHQFCVLECTWFVNVISERRLDKIVDLVLQSISSLLYSSCRLQGMVCLIMESTAFRWFPVVWSQDQCYYQVRHLPSKVVGAVVAGL